MSHFIISKATTQALFGAWEQGYSHATQALFGAWEDIHMQPIIILAIVLLAILTIIITIIVMQLTSGGCPHRYYRPVTGYGSIVSMVPPCFEHLLEGLLREILHKQPIMYNNIILQKENTHYTIIMYCVYNYN